MQVSDNGHVLDRESVSSRRSEICVFESAGCLGLRSGWHRFVCEPMIFDRRMTMFG